MRDSGTGAVCWPPFLHRTDIRLIHAKRVRKNGHSVAKISERNFSKAVARRVKIALGSGAGPFPHGGNAKEFEFMGKFGMTPAQALQSATAESAQLMGC